MSERCKQTSEWTSKWPSTYISILVCSRPQCDTYIIGLFTHVITYDITFVSIYTSNYAIYDSILYAINYTITYRFFFIDVVVSCAIRSCLNKLHINYTTYSIVLIRLHIRHSNAINQRRMGQKQVILRHQ